MSFWNEQTGTVKNTGRNSVEEVKEARKELEKQGISIDIEEETFILTDRESGVTSQGKTKKEALENLHEAVILFKEEYKNGN